MSDLPVNGFGQVPDESLYPSSPRLEYQTIVNNSNDPGYVNRLMVGTACTGMVRVEWMQARFGQVTPVNWSWVQMYQYVQGFYTLQYQVDDAQNVIVHHALKHDFQWLLLWEHDVLPQPDALLRLNEYMRKASHPVVSGLYYTRAYPSEPLVFRGAGTGAFTDFKLGDLVYCDGVPTGFLLIHMGLIKAMADEAEEYTVGDQKVKKVFWTPRKIWFEGETGFWNTQSGTSDLEWCKKIMRGDFLRKSGWGDYEKGLEDKRYPYLVDTNLFCHHIEKDGRMFP